MSDEEDDYMSDKFLTGLQDVRPSLVHNRAKKRQIEVEYKKKEQIKRQKELKKLSSAIADNDTLQKALSKPLAEENKGFKLLAKMGYKPGQALGKSVTSESSNSSVMEKRLTVPIGITIKTDRQGLGREAALKELNDKRQKIREQRLKRQLDGVPSIEEFRRRSNQKHEEKFVLNALKRCQMTCENLDLEYNMDNPEISWFWPDRTTANKEDDKEEEEEGAKTEDNGNQAEEAEQEDEFTDSEKLELLTNYMRTSYLFCYWCGIRYKDENDLNDNCPGLTKDDH